MGLAFLLPLSIYWIARAFYGNQVPKDLVLLIGTLFSLLASSPGVLFIVRREALSSGGTRYVHGFWAVISGIVWLLLFATPGVMVIIFYFQDFIATFQN